MDTRMDLLIEIGTEELPPHALAELSAAFAEGLREQLQGRQLAFDAIEPFATPRRLALLIRAVAPRQADRDVTRRGPAVQAAFDAAGAPTPAALGFARSCGVEVENLGREEGPKGSWLVHRSVQSGSATTELVPEMTEAALAGLPIPKRMRWGARNEEFVRPVHWVCLLFGETLIPGTVLGLTSAARTFGHRFHHPGPIDLASAGEYAQRLREGGFVEPSFERRRALIERQVTELAAEHGLRARLAPDLLDEVTALVEWPQALLCRFDERFLEIPPEVLVETMQGNQKYFPLEDAKGVLQARFIAVANLLSREPERVRAGNERVIRPRFADAAFFWSQDRKQPLERFAERLQGVVFQERLGTLAEKSIRVARLGATLAPTLDLDAALIERAARLAKCDLVSSMVFEFPSLQGVMGSYYAEHAAEDPRLSAALREQYLPRFAGDALPTGACGRALALADRLDTLVGVFGIGLRPSGAKDPYGLRRASIAVLRILIETPLDLDLRELLERATAGYPAELLGADTVEQVLAYMLERLHAYYGERDTAADTLEAVLGAGVTHPHDIDRRCAAVAAFRALPAAGALAAANKRIRNILAKANADDLNGPLELARLAEPAERALAERLNTLRADNDTLYARGDYIGVLEQLADLREPVDAFFDEVMVMADDPVLRRNRLRLLQALSALFLRVADISVLR